MKRLWMAFALTAGLAAAAPGAAATATTEIRSRDVLTPREALRGSMRFGTPTGWRATAASGAYTARFAAAEGDACGAAISASIRGKATRRSARAQARQAVGRHLTVTSGRRAGGVYRVGGLGPSGEARQALYGIAVVRVARRRFAHLRVFARFTGEGCTAEAAERGSVAREIAFVLRRARSHLRVARSRG